jgi:hypothetical protein
VPDFAGLLQARRRACFGLGRIAGLFGLGVDEYRSTDGR